MKATRFFAALLCGLAMSLSFSSCGSDDDDDNAPATENAGTDGTGGSAGRTEFVVEDISVNFTCACYSIDHNSKEAHAGNAIYDVVFATFDIIKAAETDYRDEVPEGAHTFSIVFQAADGEELPTGTFDVEEIGGMLNWSLDKETGRDRGIYLFDEYESGDKVTISKSGGVYTVSINPLHLVIEDNVVGGNKKVTTSFKHTGAFTKYVPKEK